MFCHEDPCSKVTSLISLADGKLKVCKQVHIQAQHTGTSCVKLVFEIGGKSV